MSYQAIKGIRRVTPFVTWDETFGSYEADYPAANLKIEPLAYVCRTDDAAVTSTRYKAAFDRDRMVRLVGIARHNVSLSGTARIRLYNGAQGTVTVDAGTDIVTLAGHGMTTGTAVTLWSPGTLLGGVTYGSVYYVHALDADTFTLHMTTSEATAGTPVVDITSTGTGNQYVLRDMVHDSDWFDFWPTVYSEESLEWEDDNWWTGKYLEDEIAGYRPTRPYILDTVTLARMITIEIDDTSNPDDYVDIGLVELARGWQFEINPSVGAQFGFRFRTREVESESGVKTFERRDKPRRFQGQIEYTSKDEAMDYGFEDQRQQDIDTLFLWVPHPTEPKHWLRDTFIARNVDPGLFAYAGPVDAFNIPIALEEVL